jgi:hypothetical protein
MANPRRPQRPLFLGSLAESRQQSSRDAGAHLHAPLRSEEDLGGALSGLFLIGAGVVLINGAWLSLMAFTLQGLNDHLSLLASLAIVGRFTGLIGAGLAPAGVQRLRQPKVEPDAVQIKRAHSAL